MSKEEIIDRVYNLRFHLKELDKPRNFNFQLLEEFLHGIQKYIEQDGDTKRNKR